MIKIRNSLEISMKLSQLYVYVYFRPQKYLETLQLILNKLVPFNASFFLVSKLKSGMLLAVIDNYTNYISCLALAFSQNTFVGLNFVGLNFSHNFVSKQGIQHRYRTSLAGTANG